MYTLLCGLALADLGYLAFTFTFYIYFSSSMELQCDHLYIRDQIIIPICNSFKATSDFIVICMTINRCQVMGNITEMRIQALRKYSNENTTSWNAYFQITAALVIASVLHLPFYFFDSLDGVLCSNNLNETYTVVRIPISNLDLKSLKILYSSYFVVSSEKTNFETSLIFKIFLQYFSFYRSSILNQFSIPSL